jgi:hypothetical protein
MKAYTDTEQSKKLAEILPLESADMDYIPVVNLENEYSINVNVWNNDHILEEDWIPAWSLSALLSVLPNYQLQTQDDGIGILCSCNGKFNIITADNPVDACVDMIIKLNELNLL